MNIDSSSIQPLSHPALSPKAAKGLWGAERTLSRATREIQESFGVDKVLKKEAFIYRDLVKESGNQILETGVTNSFRIEESRNARAGEDGGLVANNNILDTWKTAHSDERRRVVQSYDKSAADRARERNRSMVNRMPTADLDVMG